MNGLRDLATPGIKIRMVEIQIQDTSGNWVTVSNVIDNLQRISFELRSVKSRYAERRVRAVDKDGRLIDSL